jgi:hypothetical protein
MEGNDRAAQEHTCLENLGHVGHMHCSTLSIKMALLRNKSWNSSNRIRLQSISGTIPKVVHSDTIDFKPLSNWRSSLKYLLWSQIQWHFVLILTLMVRGVTRTMLLRGTFRLDFSDSVTEKLGVIGHLGGTASG